MNSPAPDRSWSSSPSFAELPSGQRVPYVEAGAGELLLFVHGSLCDYRYWQPQVAGLSNRHRCVALSLSHYWPAADDAVAAGRPFSWSAHVDEVAAFIERVGQGPAHVVGHSRGANVAYQLTRRYPERVRTLTLADPGGPLQSDGQAASNVPQTVNALRAKAAELIDAGDVNGGLQMFVDSVSRPGSWAMSTPAFRAMAKDNAHTLVLQLNDALPAYASDEAAQIRCPVLLIDGEKSPEVFHRAVAALHAWLPDARRETVRGASHGMNLAHPSAFNRYVGAFIESTAAR